MDCPKLALILCDASSKSRSGRADPFDRQINQTLTLIKSILITMEKDECVHVILLTNKEAHFEKIKFEIFGNTKKWDVGFTRRLRLEFVPLKYPPGSEYLRNVYRPCSSFGLFLPDVLPYDSVITTDTDVIFLRNIHHLWKELSKLNSSALIGVSKRDYPPKGIPYYGKNGINPGVMLMNLTRMRNAGWTQKVVAMSKPYHRHVAAAQGVEVRRRHMRRITFPLETLPPILIQLY